MTLHQLAKAQRAKINYLPDSLELSTKLIEQGFFLSSEVTLAHKAPFNGPLAFYLHGTKVCVPSDVAKQVGVQII
ncbi:FeoA family protein [Thalassotalea sp. G2M2-11]|uniref:FeoA family protein n=1 Tax=Thalassotalea sp. G2M2-11 TaxID=2787627 RepID=UPI0019D2B06E|nr:FeoA family protein [Thalassotalea sp. G2M2-11]